MKQEIKQITEKAWTEVKAAVSNPMAYMYATSFSALAGVIQLAQSMPGRKVDSDLELITNSLGTGGKIMAKNFLFFLPVNIGYAKAVDYATRKSGRTAANLVCLATNASFYGYSLLTSDNNPVIPAAVTTGVGLYLTNQQVSHIQRQEKAKLSISTSHQPDQFFPEDEYPHQ